MAVLNKILKLNSTLNKWSGKHLNWTYFIGMVLLSIVGIWIALFLTGVANNLLFSLILLIVGIDFSIWILRRKNRSNWWLLFYFIGGNLIFLLLQNKKSKRKM